MLIQKTYLERKVSGDCMYIRKKLELRLEKIMKSLGYVCHITITVRRLIFFLFLPRTIFLTGIPPESNGDTLRLPMQAISGVLS